MRGFAYLLLEFGIPRTANIKKAIHTITLLIMKEDDPDFEMDYRSVTYALKDVPKE